MNAYQLSARGPKPTQHCKYYHSQADACMQLFCVNPICQQQAHAGICPENRHTSGLERLSMPSLLDGDIRCMDHKGGQQQHTPEQSNGWGGAGGARGPRWGVWGEPPRTHTYTHTSHNLPSYNRHTRTHAQLLSSTCTNKTCHRDRLATMHCKCCQCQACRMHCRQIECVIPTAQQQPHADICSVWSTTGLELSGGGPRPTHSQADA